MQFFDFVDDRLHSVDLITFRPTLLGKVATFLQTLAGLSTLTHLRVSRTQLRFDLQTVGCLFITI